MAPHIVLDVTGHGYGHLSQVAPIVHEIMRIEPGVTFTVRTSLPSDAVHEFLGEGCRFADPPPEIGLAMTSPVDVDVSESARYYSHLHRSWPGLVEREAQKLAALAPALLISNVGYVGLAAAAAIGLPAIAISSLNWADIYWKYCRDHQGAATIHGQMLDAYRSAQMFVQLEPHLPMHDLPNRRSVGPIARVGRDQRRRLAAAISAKDTDKFALASLGGMQGRAGISSLPRVAGLRWITSAELAFEREDITPADRIDLSFIDLIRTCDVVVTKPGYGMIVESVCNGTRAVYCDRKDWPESPFMNAWARANGAASMISREAFAEGSYGQLLSEMLSRPDPAMVEPTGIAEAARLILERSL